MCCFKYPFPAKEMDELEKKVMNDPIQKIPNHVPKEFKEMILKMLKKDAAKRPTIEELIYSDVFQ
jgi:serine/threonine protein kinase|tara:strand:+ start:1174 stop:1368 length:195 start_codon:yes stop_codon:yes gene_type:complete